MFNSWMFTVCPQLWPKFLASLHMQDFMCNSVPGTALNPALYGILSYTSDCYEHNYRVMGASVVTIYCSHSHNLSMHRFQRRPETSREASSFNFLISAL